MPDIPAPWALGSRGRNNGILSFSLSLSKGFSLYSWKPRLYLAGGSPLGRTHGACGTRPGRECSSCSSYCQQTAGSCLGSSCLRPADHPAHNTTESKPGPSGCYSQMVWCHTILTLYFGLFPLSHMIQSWSGYHQQTWNRTSVTQRA